MLSKAMCLSLGVCYCDKYHDQMQHKEERFVSAHTPSLREILERTQGRNLRAGPEEEVMKEH